jgi:hypothetical protein
MMPLAKPKGAVENFKPKKHTHTCSKCGRVWNCNLQIDPADKLEWAGRKPNPINVEKMGLECWWDDNPDCVECPKKAVA